MKIGIVVHSHTGNTYSVVQKLKEKLIITGHSVNVERLETIDETKTSKNDPNKTTLKIFPDISTYDGLIFAAPVRGFSISPVLATYLRQVKTLENKKVACLVTEFFPFPWMGGNRAVAQIKNICESKGAIVSGTGVINWKNSQREKKITNLLAEAISWF